MKLSHLLLGGLLIASTNSTVPFALAQPQVKPNSTPAEIKTTPLTVAVRWRERILMLPGATAHVSLSAEIPGETDLILASSVVNLGGGGSDVTLQVPQIDLGDAKYRLRVWTVRAGHVEMVSLKPANYVTDFTAPQTVIMRRVPVDKPVTAEPMPMPLPHPVSNTEYKLSGEVTKLDRRALTDNARVVVELRDVSLADAPSKLIGTSEIELKGRQLPVDYDMLLVGFDLKPNGSYAVSARVYEGDRLSYITDTSFPFDGAKHEQKVNVRVVPALTR